MNVGLCRRILIAGLFALLLIVLPVRSEAERQECGYGSIYSAYSELALTDVKPHGWLKLYLEKMRDGLGGHMAEAAGYPFDTCMWNGAVIPPNSKQTVSAWPAYEQTGYYIDGMIRTAYILGDKELSNKLKPNFEYQITHQPANGELGPAHIDDRWCRTPFFRAMMAEHSVTHDQRIIEALKKYYLAGLSEFKGGRESTNIEIMCLLYEITGNRRLFELAEKIYATFNRNHIYPTNMEDMLSDKVPYLHGVSYSETVKLPAILYKYTGNEKYLAAAENGFRKLMKYHGLISGVHCSQERTMGNYALCRHETCNISDLTWSLGYMLMSSGKAVYGDMIEKAVFNAGMGAITKDFKAFQYLSSPNQADATIQSWHMSGGLFGPHMMYRPDHGPACCNGNLVRFLPNYVARMWMRDCKSNGVTAALYGPCSVTVPVGDDKQSVTIVEKTDYPFSDRIEFEFDTAKPVRFALSLRIPAWTKNASITVNGSAWKADVVAGQFAVIEREFVAGDRVTMTLPMSVTAGRWPLGGVGLERGPLVYSLALEAETQIASYGDSAKQFPAYSMVAKSDWNYAIHLEDAKGVDAFKVTTGAVPADPWAGQESPVTLEVPAYKLDAWRFDYKAFENKDGTVSFYPHTPELPNPWSVTEMSHYMADKNKATLHMVPLGRTLLRMTIFPVCSKRAGYELEDMIDGATYE